MRRRVSALHAVILASVLGLVAASGLADDVTVPIVLQVDLLDRVVRFERGYASRASEGALVLCVIKADVTASARAAAQIGAAIGSAQKLGGRPAKAASTTFSSPDALRAAARDASIVFLTPGFSQAELQGIAQAFSGSHVITVGTAQGDVEGGATLGFELESAKPKVVVNLVRARAQGLDFSAQLLRLARVIR